MKIDRIDLIAKLKRCLPGIDKTVGLLLGTDCFVFRNKSILAYNDCISITMPLDLDLSCAVPAAPFYKALTSFKAKEVDIVQEGSKLTMTCGRAIVHFPVLEENIYDRFLHILPVTPEWKELPDDFVATMKMALINTVSKMDGIFVHGPSMLSTNNVTILAVDLGMPVDRFWINNKTVKELIKLPALQEYCSNSTWIHFKSGDVTFSCRKLIDENYPEMSIHKILDMYTEDTATSVGTLPDDLLEVLDRASIFSDMDNSEDAKVIHCAIKGNELTISSSRSTGSFEETIPLEREGDGDVSWAMDVEQFIAALKRSGKGVKFFVSKEKEGGAIVLTGDRWKQAIGLVKTKE